MLNAALRSPKVKDVGEIQKELDPVAWLEKKINVDYGISPEIMRISMSGPDSKQLPILVEAVRDAYLNEIVDKEYQARLGRLELLKELYAQYELGLKKKREDLRTLANGLGSTNPQLVAVKQEFAWRELHTIQTELLSVQSQLRKAHLEVVSQTESEEGAARVTVQGASTVGLLGSLGNGPLLAASAYVSRGTGVTDPSIPDGLIDEFVKKDGDYDRCFKLVAHLEKDRDFLMANTNQPEEEPSYKRIIRDLEVARKTLAICRDEIRPRMIRQAREKLFGETKPARGQPPPKPVLNT